MTLEEIKRLCEEMIEKREKATQGEWKSGFGLSDQHDGSLLSHDQDFYRDEDAVFTAFAANNITTLATSCLRLIKALEKCKAQRNTYHDIADCEGLTARSVEELDAEIDAILKGDEP